MSYLLSVVVALGLGGGPGDEVAQDSEVGGGGLEVSAAEGCDEGAERLTKGPLPRCYNPIIMFI